MKKLRSRWIGIFLLAVFPWYSITSVVAQDWTEPESGSSEADPFGGDPFEGTTTDESELPPLEQSAPPPPPQAPAPSTSSTPFGAPASKAVASVDGHIQNAIIEGVQLSSEPGDQSDEKIVSCYFIFRDKPSSYFYEIKQRERKLIFEFNDTKTGASPVPSSSESPIRGFTIEQRKVDVNKEVRGLKPEWHDLIRVTFDLEAVPEVHVNDEYSIISFSYKWTTNPANMEKYVVKDKSPAVFLWSSTGLVGVGLGILSYFLWIKPPPETPPLEPLTTSDLPQHQF